MRNKTLTALFLLAVAIDLIAYNREYIPVKIISFQPSMFFIYFIRDIPLLDKIYFLGYAIDYTLIILIISMLTKEIFVLNLSASAYLGVCLNNIYDEITDNNLTAYPAEYFFLLFSIGLVLYKIHIRKNPNHSVGHLFDNFRSKILLWIFRNKA